ncbi:hypothetical protein [Pseudomonas fluorescens]|uniref:Uncharacterized protein n=1 Tax=Pseudomonas fluorescens TaxID=294 RepID=A0A5E7HG88_PSEFL|nr:hypothetical protein [Pseudomonas fluorescens]VVO62920.1 hypothetical protein PS854_00898 [Pseudomonas fluorescens]
MTNELHTSFKQKIGAQQGAIEINDKWWRRSDDSHNNHSLLSWDKPKKSSMPWRRGNQGKTDSQLHQKGMISRTSKPLPKPLEVESTDSID